MKNFKKILAFLCSATLIAGSSVTAFASSSGVDATPAADDRTGGDGFIVAYSCETVTVPTTVKVSFNPQGWDFVTRGTTTSDDQIVSLNYGIASAATLDKKVSVEFTIVGNDGDGDNDILFVDSAKKAEAKSSSNPDGAAPNEYKMYLAVAPSKAAVASGYAADATSPTDFAISGTPKTSNVATGLLGDVVMEAATGTGVTAFADNKASIAYKLGKQEYELQTNKNPTWTTTQSNFSSMVQPKTLGDIVGFTFVGAMNPDADWTKVKFDALAITPTYEVEDVDGTETVLETPATNGYNVIAAAAASTASTLALELVTATGNLRYTFPESGRPTGELTAVTVNGTSRAGAISAGNIFYKAENGNFIITKTAVDNADIGIVQGGTTVVATIGGTEYTFTY